MFRLAQRLHQHCVTSAGNAAQKPAKHMHLHIPGTILLQRGQGGSAVYMMAAKMEDNLIISVIKGRIKKTAAQ